MSYTVQALPETERPRERLIQHGCKAMTTVELIAIVLSSGTRAMPVLQLAQEIMSRFGTLKNLSEASIEEICQVPGVGKVKAIQLKAALSLGKRASETTDESRPRLITPRHVYRLLKETFAAEDRELFIVVLLDTKGGLIGHHIVTVGTLSKTVIHPREVFFPAVRRKAASILLVHNHPSGDLTPSKQDIEITQVLIESGKTMGIPVHDHLIIGRAGYLSLREQGVTFS